MSTRDYDKTYIIDTSVILDDVYSIFPLSEGGKNRVIIPETTLDEIDSKKKGFEDINFQAREFNRLLDDAVTLDEYDIDFEGEKLSSVLVMIHDATFELVSKKDYKVSILRDPINIVNDRKILEIASCFKNSTVVSNDIAMRIRARSIKLNSEPLKRNRTDDVENLEFIEVIHINSSQKEKIEYAKDAEFGKKFSHFTNVEFICDDTGEHILALYRPDGFHVIDEKKLRKLVIKPRNKEQIFFLNMLLDKDLPIVVCAGVTGSGKNLLSLQGALKYTQISNLGKVNPSIRYCRNTITAGDTEAQLGFLKGDETAKLGVFTYPLYDAISTYMEQEQEDAIANKKAIPVSSNKDFMEEHNIEVVNINQMRGANLTGFLIFDEWQNSSASVNKLMLTRVIEGSKVVIIGDIHQIDHHHLSKYNNALAIMLKFAKTSDIVGGITMSRVVRGRVAAFADANL